MARRYIVDEPTSRLATWARRMALFSLTATVLSVIIVYSDVLEMRPAIITFVIGLVPAAIALLLAFGAFVVIWIDGLKGLGRALAGAVIAVAILAYPGYLGYQAYKLPWIYDITTDPIDPPRYEGLAPLRARDANPVTYAGLYAAEQQRAAYPDIEPLEEESNPEAAYRAALAVITRRKWIIIQPRAPIAGRREGHIEAVARTLPMGFRDDVVVRVRGDDEGSRIDIRSSARYGSFDFGRNAARVRSLLDDIDDAIGDQKPEAPALPAKKPAPQPKKPPAPQPSARR